MSRRERFGRALPAVIVGAVAVLLIVWWWVGGPREAEPRSQPRAATRFDAAAPSLDAGLPPPGDGGGATRRSTRGSGSDDTQQDRSTVGRLDGAVQLHLPPPPEYPNPSVTTPAELRQRRIEQIGTIGTRIERLNDEINRGSPDRALLEVRRDRLVRRREQLTQALLDEAPPSP